MDIESIESMVSDILRNRKKRLDVLELGDMNPVGYRPRPRPKTDIIAKAAKEAIEAREWSESNDI